MWLGSIVARLITGKGSPEGVSKTGKILSASSTAFRDRVGRSVCGEEAAENADSCLVAGGKYCDKLEGRSNR